MRKFLFPLLVFVLVTVATGLAPVFEPGAKAVGTPPDNCDYNCDGVVNLTDVGLFATYFYNDDPRADLNNDAVSPHNLLDVVIMAQSYGSVVSGCCY